MKFLLVSRFNTQNIGDLAIANQLKHELLEYANTDCLSLFGKVDQFCDINNIRNNSSNISDSKNNKLFSKINSKIKVKINEISKKRKIEELIDDGTVMVIGGGNMLCDLEPNSASTKRFMPFVNIAKKKRIKIFAMDIGIGPFATERQYDNAIELLNKFDYITFRDPGSYLKYINKAGKTDRACISLDPAFFYKKRNSRKIEKKHTVGISIIDIRHLGKGKEEFQEMQDNFVRLARSLRDKLGLKIIFFATDFSDEDALKGIMNMTLEEEDIEVRTIDGYKDLETIYKSIDLLVGTRMHSLILAYTQLIPIIGLSWQDKVTDMFEIIDFKDALFFLDNIQDNIENITSYCNGIYQNYPETIKRVQDSYVTLQKKKSIDDEILKKLNRG